MARVFLSLGSNISRDENIKNGLKSLMSRFGRLEISSVYESESVGFIGDNFYNLVVGLNTALGVGELLAVLRNIENENGRNRSSPKFSSRTLDIDILTYDNAVGVVDSVSLPRDEILTNAFVLQPMAELVPNDVHPVALKTYAELWKSFDKTSQFLWVVPFEVPAQIRWC